MDQRRANRRSGLLGGVGADLVDVDAGRPPVGEQGLTPPTHHLERPHPGGECHPPRVVGAVVAPRHAVVGRLGDEAVAGEQPRPRRVRAGRHVVGRGGRRTPGGAPRACRRRCRRCRARPCSGAAAGRAYPTPLFMLLRGLWAIVPGRSRSSSTQCTSSQSIACQVGQAGAGVGVGWALGDVDVDADAEIGGQSRGGGQRVVGARERGVHADHPPPTGAHEALVLGQPAARPVGPVAVGDAVRTHARDADLGARLGDHVEAALDRVRALVMVDDAGGAAHQRLGGAEAGAGPDHVEVEGCVEAPPHLLEDLMRSRVGVGRWRRHARAPAPSTGGGGRRRNRAWWRSSPSSVGRVRGSPDGPS